MNISVFQWAQGWDKKSINIRYRYKNNCKFLFYRWEYDSQPHTNQSSCHLSSLFERVKIKHCARNIWIKNSEITKQWIYIYLLNVYES